MPKCKGVTKSGGKCRANITGDYCRWHTISVEECVVCLEPITEPLSCGHWIHRECIQKHADIMQEIRAEDGYPPLLEGHCSICRASVPDVLPKAPSPLPPLLHPLVYTYEQFIVSLTQNEIQVAYHTWIDSSRHRPLAFYIMCQLYKKYPDHPPSVLLALAQLFILDLGG